MPAQQLLITGGAGFLGAHVADRLRRDGVRVRLFDVEACPGWARKSDIEYVRGDMRDPTAVAAALEGVDVVVHAAFAAPHQPAKVIHQVNVEGTHNLCVKAYTRGRPRVILISSTIVLKPRRVHPLFRNSPLTRLDLYRASRVEAERIISEYGSRGLSTAIIRPKTFVGPGCVSAFALLFERLRLGQSVPVLGSGWNRYQLLDIRDLAEAIRLLTATDAKGVFFFGSREVRTVREDLLTLLNHARTGARLQFIPGWIARIALRSMELVNIAPLAEWHYMSARGEDSTVDASRAEQELGWHPERSNAQALTEAYDWYVATVAVTGTAEITHPVPSAHRALQRLTWLFPQ